MKINNTANEILKNLGGELNIKSFTHCATRLRFDINNLNSVNQDNLNQLKDVMGVINKGGQLQLVIGPSVEKLYNELISELREEKKLETNEKDNVYFLDISKKKVIDSFVSYISGAIQPTLPVLIGAGMINAILAVSVIFGLNPTSQTYIAWSAIASIGFSYLPVFVAFSAAKKLKTNEFVASFLALAMIVSFNQKEGISMYGFLIPYVKYSNSIIPILLVIPFQLLVDKICSRVVPSAAHFTVKPLIISFFTVPAVLFVFGPIGSSIGTFMANICIWLMSSLGWFSMAFLSGFHAITVIFGMHYLFTPIMANEVAQTGYTFILCRALAANFAMAGAAFAVGVKAKKNENRSIGFSSSLTALLSVSEPALYGCLIKLRKPLISSCIAAAITGIFIGYFQVKAYVIASPCLLSMPIFIGNGDLQNFVLACISALIAFSLSFILTFIIGFDE